MSVPLSLVLKEVMTLPPVYERAVSGMSLDSRKIKKGDVFIALQGVAQDGRQFIQDAIRQEAAAVLVEHHAGGHAAIQVENNIPIIPVEALRTRVGSLAATFYHHPAWQLDMIGVTGTNGKTSCTHFIAQLLQQQNIACGVIGTLGCGVFNQLQSIGLTTPDAVSLQRYLHEMLANSIKTVAMEVSSHSIDQGRVNAIPFKIGIYTNLSQDHLDYHGTMEAYAAVKKRFLFQMPVESLVINIDDPYGAVWAQELAVNRDVYTYSLSSPAIFESDKTIFCENLQLSEHGIAAKVVSPWGQGELVLPLVGQFNLSNALAAMTAVCIKGIPFEQALAGMHQLVSVPGRMQVINKPGRPLVVVDFAHTPDALKKALEAARLHTSDKLICVFGCGGDRDAGKRPLMGAVASELADTVIVTSDNPRTESMDAIIADIMQGINRSENIHNEVDRTNAIKKSIELASENDCILIAGKGAEQYQQIGQEKIPFDDVVCATTLLDSQYSSTNENIL